jgi:predicted esterase
MNEHHLTVSRTARYFTLGVPEQALHVWFVCHGYGQLASQFLGYFTSMQQPGRLLVAPEALSRFYHDQGAGPIGASWMTREDRVSEINDYLQYLDALHATIRLSLPEGSQCHVLGFSQGVATAIRWKASGSAPLAGAVFWAGSVPPDLDLTACGSRFLDQRLAFVAGTEDPVISADWRTRQCERFTAIGAECLEFSFSGGHRLDRMTLTRVVDELESGSPR